MIEVAQIVTPKANILEGLHVLLVTEDDVRAAALTRALRDLKASVGDVKVSGKDAFALRGADLLVVDARTQDATRSRVTELRSDVRGRWGSLIELDYTKLVLDDGAILLKPLEEAAGPHVLADKELTERARKEEKLELKLAPLGPSRVLRALAAAGPTMHVQIVHETLSASVDLSNELLVCAFAERGTSEKWEAWTALVRILGLPDATVYVSRRSHPSAMNIMEPIDQALEVAAQERHSSAALIAVEERSARARAAQEEAAKAPAPRPAPQEIADLPAVAPSNKAAVFGAPKIDRTLVNLSGGSPPQLAQPVRPPAESRYAVGDSAADRVKPPARTLLGMAGMNAGPATLPALGGKGKPAAAAAAPAMPTPVKEAPHREPPPPAPAVKGMSLPRVTFGDVPTDPHLAPPVELLHEKPTVEFHAQEEQHRANVIPASAPANDTGRADEATTSVNDAATTRELVASMDMELPRPDEDIVDLPAATVSKGPAYMKGRWAAPTAKEQEPASQAAAPPPVRLPTPIAEAKPAPAPPPVVAEAKLPPALPPALPSQREPVDPRAQTQQLMAVIEEAVDDAVFSVPPGEKPMVAAPPSAATETDDTVFMARPERKSRTKVLSALLALAVLEAGVVVYLDRKMLGADKETAVAVASRTTAPPRARGVAPSPQAAQAEVAANQPPANEQPANPAPSAQPAPTPEQPAQAAPAPENAPAPTGVTQPAVAPEPAPTKPEPAPAKPEEAKVEAEPSAPPEGEKTKPARNKDSDSLVKEGSALLAANDAAGARASFMRAIEADGKNPHAYAGLAEASLASGDSKGATLAIQTAIKLRPKRARYRVIQGDILKAEGNAEGAQAAYREAVQIDPDDREAKKRLAGR